MNAIMQANATAQTARGWRHIEPGGAGQAGGLDDELAAEVLHGGGGAGFPGRPGKPALVRHCSARQPTEVPVRTERGPLR